MEYGSSLGWREIWRKMIVINAYTVLWMDTHGSGNELSSEPKDNSSVAHELDVSSSLVWYAAAFYCIVVTQQEWLLQMKYSDNQMGIWSLVFTLFSGFRQWNHMVFMFADAEDDTFFTQGNEFRHKVSKKALADCCVGCMRYWNYNYKCEGWWQVRQHIPPIPETIQQVEQLQLQFSSWSFCTTLHTLQQSVSLWLKDGAQEEESSFAVQWYSAAEWWTFVPLLHEENQPSLDLAYKKKKCFTWMQCFCIQNSWRKKVFLKFVKILVTSMFRIRCWFGLGDGFKFKFRKEKCCSPVLMIKLKKREKWVRCKSSLKFWLINFMLLFQGCFLKSTRRTN